MNIHNVKRLLKHVYLKHRQGLYVPIMFVGPTGVGKSSVIDQLAEECRKEFDLPDFRTINYRLSQKEQGDLIGNPIEIEMVPCPYCVENGQGDFHQNILHEKKKLLEHVHKFHGAELRNNGGIPSYLEIMDLIRSKYSHLIEIRTGYAVPDQLPLDGHGILHLDELNRATKSVRDAVFELVWERRLGKYQLPPGWIVVCSINPPSEDYIVYELDRAMVERYCIIRFCPEHSEFMTYAAKRQLYEPVRTFVSEYPQFLGNDMVEMPYEKKPCPRGLEMMAILLDGLPSDLVYEVAAGCIGFEAASAFMSILNSKERPISAKKILENYEEVSDQVRKYSRAKKNRADLLRVSIDDLIVLLSKKKNPLSDDEIQNLTGFIKDIPKDLAVGFIKLMVKNEDMRDHFTRLSESEELREFMQQEFKNIGCESL